MANSIQKQKSILARLWALLVLVTLLTGSLEGVQAAPAARLSPNIAVMNSFHPQFLVNYAGITSTLSSINASWTMANMVVTLYDTGGMPAYAAMGVVPQGGGLAINASDLAGVPAGIYSAVVSSDQPLQSVVSLYRPGGNLLAIYSGLTPGSSSGHLVIGPLNKNSAAVLQNTSPASAAVSTQFYTPDGAPVGAPKIFMVQPGAAYSILVAAQTDVPADFNGMAVVSSDNPLAGLVVQRSQRPGAPMQVNSMSNAQSGASTGAIARALKGVDEDGGPRSTAIFVGYPAAGSDHAEVTLFFLDSSGQTVSTVPLTLQPNQSQLLSLDSLASLTEGQVYAVRMVSTQPVSLNEVTDYRGVPTSSSSTSYTPINYGDNSMGIARLALTRNSHSIFSIQNADSAANTLTITFKTLDGTPVTTRTPVLPAGGWVRYDLRDLAADLGSSFVGVATVQSTYLGGAAIPLAAVVDEFYIPCTPVANVAIDRIPAGEVFTGDNVQFTGSAAGTAPLTYAWTLDLADANAHTGLWEHSFAAAGSYSVGVTVSNACGSASQSVSISVGSPAANQPDLSTSNMTPSLASVSNGGTLTYTAMLRNTGLAAAASTFSDTLPGTLNYVAGSGGSSDGGAVIFDGSAVSWAGSVAPGNPVLITFQATISGASIGSTLSNLATLSDGMGHSFPLTASSEVVQDFSLLINNGGLSTNDSQVSLGYTWDTRPDMVYFKVSNDPGFAAGANTSEWTVLDIVNRRLDGWALNPSSDMRMPYTVYIRFRSRDGIEFGPFQDDIIYDPVAPVIGDVIARPAAGLLALGTGPNFTVTVNASDLISGVKELQTSATPNFAVIDRFIPVTGLVTQFTWSAGAPPPLYLRAVDRSGNFSEVKSLLDKKFFVPILKKFGP